MTRLVRWAFNFAAAVSAVLLVGVCVLWVGSRWQSCYVHFSSKTRTVGLGSEPNRIDVWLSNFSCTRFPTFEHWPDDQAEDFAAESSVRFSRAGFRYYITTASPSLTTASLDAPDWFLAAALSVAPAAWFLRRQSDRRRLLRSGCCPVCGYDLRATPSRCPECGTVPTRRTTT